MFYEYADQRFSWEEHCGLSDIPCRLLFEDFCHLSNIASSENYELVFHIYKIPYNISHTNFHRSPRSTVNDVSSLNGTPYPSWGNDGSTLYHSVQAGCHNSIPLTNMVCSCAISWDVSLRNLSSPGSREMLRLLSQAAPIWPTSSAYWTVPLIPGGIGAQLSLMVFNMIRVPGWYLHWVSSTCWWPRNDPLISHSPFSPSFCLLLLAYILRPHPGTGNHAQKRGIPRRVQHSYRCELLSLGGRSCVGTALRSGSVWPGTCFTGFFTCYPPIPSGAFSDNK